MWDQPEPVIRIVRTKRVQCSEWLLLKADECAEGNGGSHFE